MSTEKTKFTEGPWEIVDVLEEGQISMTVGGRGDVHITHWPCPIPLEERKANAALIASAPELYEALQRALKYMEITRRYLPSHGTFSEDRINDFNVASAHTKAALKKATIVS